MERIGRRKPQFGLLAADYFLWMCCIPAHMKRYFADRQDVSYQALSIIKNAGM